MRMNRSIFQSEYEYDVETDFGLAGEPASWAEAADADKPAHRFWGDEDFAITVPLSISEEEDGAGSGTGTALIRLLSTMSPDDALVAVSGGALISVYRVQTRALTAQFRGPPQICSGLTFVLLGVDQEGEEKEEKEGGRRWEAHYALMSQNVDKLFIYKLDKHGHRIDPITPLETKDLTLRSMDAIAPALATSYNLSLSSPLFSTLQRSFTSALEVLASELESSDLPTLTGRLPGRRTRLQSPDNKYLLYISNNKRRPQDDGSLPEEDLPKIIIHDLSSHTQRQSLEGHTKSILWAQFSPDGKTIASSSSDGTLKFWDAESGVCRHTTEPNSGQIVDGAWSSDSRFTVVHGSERKDGGLLSFVAVYARESGREVSRFRDTGAEGNAAGEGEKVKRDRISSLDWSEDGQVIAIGATSGAYVWRSFENEIVSRFQVGKKGSMDDRWVGMFGGVHVVKFASEGGRLLIVQTGDGTIEVWDRAENVKWRLQRPKAVVASKVSHAMYWVEESRTLLSLDGDGCLRFWKI